MKIRKKGREVGRIDKEFQDFIDNDQMQDLHDLKTLRRPTAEETQRDELSRDISNCTSLTQVQQQLQRWAKHKWRRYYGSTTSPKTENEKLQTFLALLHSGRIFEAKKFLNPEEQKSITGEYGLREKIQSIINEMEENVDAMANNGVPRNLLIGFNNIVELSGSWPFATQKFDSYRSNILILVQHLESRQYDEAFRHFIDNEKKFLQLFGIDMAILHFLLETRRGYENMAKGIPPILLARYYHCAINDLYDVIIEPIEPKTWLQRVARRLGIAHSTRINSGNT